MTLERDRDRRRKKRSRPEKTLVRQLEEKMARVKVARAITIDANTRKQSEKELKSLRRKLRRAKKKKDSTSNEASRKTEKKWKKRDSKRWDFNEEFSIRLHDFGGKSWDVELWKSNKARAITEVSSGKKAREEAKFYRDVLKTEEDLESKWEQIKGRK